MSISGNCSGSFVAGACPIDSSSGVRPPPSHLGQALADTISFMPLPTWPTLAILLLPLALRYCLQVPPTRADPVAHRAPV